MSKPAPTAFERLRRWPRAAVRIAGRLTESGAVVLVHDLSEGGVQLHVDPVDAEACRPGHGVTVEFALVPGLPTMALSGNVVWSYGRHVGIELGANATRDLACVRRAVAYHLGQR